MRYSIEFQIAGLLLLITLAVDFFVKKHVENKGTKVFPILLIVEIVSVVLDIIKTIVLAERLNFSPWVAESVWKLYSISVMTFALFFSKYCTSLCEKNRQGKFSVLHKVLSIFGWFAYIVSVLVLIIFVKPEYFEIDKGYIVIGIGLWLDAMFSFGCVGVSMIYVFLSRKVIDKKSRLCVYLSWFGSLIFILLEHQFHVLLMGFSLSFVVLIIYLTLENPDFGIIQELDDAKKHADDANRAKSVFLATMSHEIRTPMSIVMGMNEMVLRECDDKQILEYSKNIHDASQSLLTIINDVLDFSKIESGKMDLEEKNYDTRNFFKSLIKQFDFKANEKKLEFEAIISEDIPSILYGDDVRLRQIISNLLANAIKYTKVGKVTLKVDCETKRAVKISNESDYEIAELFISVSDTGIGIKEEDQARIFDSFQRVRSDLNGYVEGTGLGLSITLTLLHLMGSDINVKSKYGEGSEFYFKLNLRVVNPTPIGKLTDDDFGKVERPKALMFKAPAVRILTVDDSDMNLMILTALLKKTNMTVDSAASGAECLEKVRENKYDLIFLDHMMPEMDGIETLRRMEKIDLFVKTKPPVVALTANAILGAKNMYLNVGFTDYISKPIDSHRLEDVLLKYIPKEKIER